VISYLHENSGGKFPIIGVGGIMTADDAMDKFKAGASLIQLYSGFIYSGPKLIEDINKRLIS
jgi:dihydroorotate dehydrogenase